MNLPDGYIEFSPQILEGWINKGILYVSQAPLHAPMYNYGDESAIELIPYTAASGAYYSITSDYIQNIALERVDPIVFVVHEDNL